MSPRAQPTSPAPYCSGLCQQGPGTPGPPLWVLLRSRSHSKTHRQDRGSSCQAWGQTRPSVPHLRATMALESRARLTSCPQASGLEDPPVPFSQALLSLKYSQLSAGARAGSSGARGGATGTLQVPNRGSTPGGARHREGRLDGPDPPAKHLPGCSHRGQHQGRGHVPCPWAAWPQPAFGQV